MMNEERDLELDGMESIELTDEELAEVVGGKQKIRVKVSEANLRSGAGKDHAVIWVLGKGEELTYLGEKKKDKHNKTWVKVKAMGMTGWVRADLVKK